MIKLKSILQAGLHSSDEPIVVKDKGIAGAIEILQRRVAALETPKVDCCCNYYSCIRTAHTTATQAVHGKVTSATMTEPQNMAR